MNDSSSPATFQHFDPDVMRGERIHRFYNYWLEKKQGKRFPDQSSVDVLELDDLIGIVSYIDVLNASASSPGDGLDSGAGPRFRLRLIGSEVVFRSGQDNTGKIVDEIEDEVARDILLASYSEVTSRQEPYWVNRESIFDGKLYVYECLIVPLADATGTISRLMSIVDYPPDRG